MENDSTQEKRGSKSQVDLLRSSVLYILGSSKRKMRQKSGKEEIRETAMQQSFIKE